MTSVKTVALASAVFGCLSVPAVACDLMSSTDASCGMANPTAYFNNPANPDSPFNMSNPANPSSSWSSANRHRDPNSPYFSEPTYADGIFGLFERNPRIVYPAGQPQTCRLGLDCPADVARSSGATLYGLRPVAQAAAPASEAPVVPHRQHRRRRLRAER